MGSKSATGFLDPSNVTHEATVLDFIIRQITGKMATATIVKVKSVTTSGELAPIGMVSVTPMVSQVDGAGKLYEHGTLYNLPYLRIQGGNNAIIIDPQVGDTGIAWFASRDISKVKTTKKSAGPGSSRKHDMSDGMYGGSLLMEAPTTYLRFSNDGSEIEIKTTTLTLNCDVQLNGAMTATGDVTANGISLDEHVHGGVQGGTGESGGPIG